MGSTAMLQQRCSWHRFTQLRVCLCSSLRLYQPDYGVLSMCYCFWRSVSRADSDNCHFRQLLESCGVECSECWLPDRRHVWQVGALDSNLRSLGTVWLSCEVE